MKTLLCDFGNSRLKFAATDGKRLFDSSNLACPRDANARECLTQACYSEQNIEHILISSVRDEAFNRELEKTAQQLNLTIRFAATRFEAFNMRSDYDASCLGVDRFLAMLAARDSFDGAFAVVDCGSATTVDFVDANGCHQGGYIAPGLDMMRGSLSDGAARLPAVESSGESSAAWPRDTRAAIEQGCVLTLRHAVSGIVRERHALRDEQVVVTGGNASLVARDAWSHRPQLVLEGLARYAQVAPE